MAVPALPVISVGNITVGGSGKTPVAIWLAQLLHARGLKPAVIARGYGAADGALNDEMLLAARKCPYAVVLANPDRVAGIDEAAFHGARLAILDDAFQHRRVRRNVDIVLVDATRGFGNGHMLPAGPLREPIGSLKRADIVLLTRVEQVGPERLAKLCEQIRRWAGEAVSIGRISFRQSSLTDLKFAPADGPAGPAGVFAGIGNFGAFVETCRQAGVEVAGQMALPDHCRYDEALCRRIADWAAGSHLACLVTTEKDAAKLSRIEWRWPVPVRVLGIEAVPDETAQTFVENALDAIQAIRTDGPVTPQDD